jgi:hypothetical protein
MPSIVAYYRNLPREARQRVDDLGSVTIMEMGDDAVDRIVADLVQRFRRPTNLTAGAPDFSFVNPAVPSEGVVVTIPLEHGGQQARDLMDWIPSTIRRIGGEEPRVRVSDRGIEFTVRRRVEADQALEVLQANIAERNRELAGQNSLIEQSIRPVIEQAVLDVRAKEAAAAAEWEDLLGAGERSVSTSDGSRSVGSANPLGSSDSVEASESLSVVPDVDAQDQRLVPIVESDPAEREFLSHASAVIAGDDSKAFERVVDDVRRRMRSLSENQSLDARLRVYAEAAASSLEVVLGEVRGEFGTPATGRAAMSLDHLLIELGQIGIQLANPTVGALTMAGRLIVQYLQRQIPA